MAPFAEYEEYDGLGLAELVRRRQVTPTELLEAALERVEARNRGVNAVVMRLDDHARRTIAAGVPDGPFCGVPFLPKDLTASLAGAPMTRASRFFADAPAPTEDSEHVRRLKRAGLVVFGRTNTCELGLSLTCEPQLYGPTRNPWDLTRISGGRAAVRRPPWERACCRWPTPPTVSGPSARPLRAAGSSASSPLEAATPWRPTPVKVSPGWPPSTR